MALAGASRFATVLTEGPVAGELLSASGIAGQFALYGALHALALVSSLRARPSMGRQTAFVAVAAVTSLATAWLAFMLLRRMPNLGGVVPILIAAASVGAWGYAGAIRCVLRLDLGARSTLWISLACAAAVAAAYPWVKHVPRVAALGLAIPWWLAFSVALALALRDAGRRHETIP